LSFNEKSDILVILRKNFGFINQNAENLEALAEKMNAYIHTQNEPSTLVYYFLTGGDTRSHPPAKKKEPNKKEPKLIGDAEKPEKDSNSHPAEN
jgi:hypothetical protein